MAENAGEQTGHDTGKQTANSDLPLSESRPTMRRRKSTLFRLLISFTWLFVFVAGFLTAGFVLVEQGYFDAPLNREAKALLTRSFGKEDFVADVTRTSVRFNRQGQILLVVHGVSIRSRSDNNVALNTKSAHIAINVLPLLVGRLSIGTVGIDGAGVDFDALSPEDGKVGHQKAEESFRIDSIPDLMSKMFSMFDRANKIASEADARSLDISGMSFDLPAQQDRKAHLVVREMSLKRLVDGNLEVKGDMSVDGKTSSIEALAQKSPNGISDVTLKLKNFNLTPFLTRSTREGKPFIGLDGGMDMTIKAKRGLKDQKRSLNFEVLLADSAFYGEGEAAPVTSGEIAGYYDFSAGKIEINKGDLDSGETRIPFSGGLIDADRLKKKTGPGIAVDLLISGGYAAPANLGDMPVNFDAKVFGTFDPKTEILSASDVGISTKDGFIGGSLTIKFDLSRAKGMTGDSPEISLGLYTDGINSNSIRALWPFWLGIPARQWVYQNLFGGRISKGSLALFLASGRLPLYPEDTIVLNSDEFRIKLDVANTRVTVAGDIPPMRDTIAHFELNGPKVNADIEKATVYFPSGRTVKLSNGTFDIADTSALPVIAQTRFDIKGKADALAELATYRPISALQKTGFKPGDFSGDASVSLKARFPLEASSNGPEPDWVANLNLDDVSIKPKIGGRSIDSVTGTMVINPLSMNMQADLRADGAPLHISLIEPLSKRSRQKRRRRVTANLTAAELAKLVPGIDDIISGRVGLDMLLLDNGGQSIKADLGRATVSIPWAGWEKGNGIPATVQFISKLDGQTYKISDFKFSGEGFGASGQLQADKYGLVSAHFSKVQLVPDDDLSMNVMRSGHSYKISANGKSADIRSLLTKIKSAKSDGLISNTDVSVSAKLDIVTGFDGEILKNVDAVYAVKNGKPVAVKLTAVSGKNQAVVAKLASDIGTKRTIELTSTDAGALLRFAGLYKNMYSGLMNLKMRYISDGVWNGIVDVRNFRLVNEKRLQEIVSTPAGKNGKSLNQAVKRNIDVSSQKFSRGYSRILINGDVLKVENGVVRGEQVGATFQGILRDGKGQMNMTGTFMPAYGLNRLFAELPVIGLILGNGRDRGLIGITFRISGPVDKPKLAINPLSIIAPGVFRNIFEFQ